MSKKRTIEADILLGSKPSQWFTDNFGIILKDGQMVHLKDQGKYKVGNGTSSLGALAFYPSNDGLWGSIGGTITNQTDLINYLVAHYQNLAEKGVANGYATLDNGGKVPSAQLPNSVMQYQGQWNATSNSPTLVNGVGDAGDVYEVIIAGTTNFGAGNITFKIGDWVVYNGSIWEKSINSNEVVSVNGYTGALNLIANDLLLTGYAGPSAGTVSASDTIKGAIAKLDGNITAGPALAYQQIGVGSAGGVLSGSARFTYDGTIVLSINDASAFSVQSSTGAGTQGFYINNSTGAYIGKVISDQSTGELRIQSDRVVGNYVSVWTNGNERFRVANNGVTSIKAGLTLTLGSDTTGDMYYNGGSGVVTRLVAGAAGKFIMFNGVAAVPIVSTLVLPNSVTANAIVFSTSSNTYGESVGLTYDLTTLTVGNAVSPIINLKSTSGSGVPKIQLVNSSGNAVGLLSGNIAGGEIRLEATSIGNYYLTFLTGGTQRMSIESGALGGRISIGTGSPTASFHITRTSSTAANSASFKIDAGSALMTTPEIGAFEFIADKVYWTITTGPARKEFTLNDAALTPASIPMATTNGRITDSSLVQSAGGLFSSLFFKVGATTVARRTVLYDLSALGEIPTGAVISPSNSNLTIACYGFDASSTGDKLVAAYWDGTQTRSAWEITNVASGFGTLSLMKSGGIVAIGDTSNISFGTGTGTKIGTGTTQKIGFWNAAPLAQQTTGSAAATFVTNTSGTINDTATWDGYTIGQVIKVLRNIGILA